jgi:hypothetical protein
MTFEKIATDFELSKRHSVYAACEFMDYMHLRDGINFITMKQALEHITNNEDKFIKFMNEIKAEHKTDSYDEAISEHIFKYPCGKDYN